MIGSAEVQILVKRIEINDGHHPHLGGPCQLSKAKMDLSPPVARRRFLKLFSLYITNNGNIS